MSPLDGSDWFVKLTVAAEPSSTGPSLPSVAVGATLVTPTVFESVPVSVPSETVTVTFGLDGPSANVHEKPPAPVEASMFAPVTTLPVPQDSLWSVNVSPVPGSLTVNE